MALTNYMGIPKVYNPVTGEYEEPDMQVLADLLGANQQGQPVAALAAPRPSQAQVRAVDNRILPPEMLAGANAGPPAPAQSRQPVDDGRTVGPMGNSWSRYVETPEGFIPNPDYVPSAGSKTVRITGAPREQQGESSLADIGARYNAYMKKARGGWGESSDPAYSSQYRKPMTEAEMKADPEFQQIMMDLGMRKTLKEASPQVESTYDKELAKRLAEIDAAKVAAATPGTPESERAVKATAAEAAKEKARSSALSGATNVLGAIDNARSLISGASTGLPGQVLSVVGGTQAKALDKALDPIRANIGFDRLQRMREESATGGALGQVAVQELMMLQSTISSLDQAQSQEGLQRSLDLIEQHYNNYLDAMYKAYQAGEFKSAPTEFIQQMTGKSGAAKGQQSQQATGAVPKGALVPVASEQQAMTLPPGTRFRLPDGRTGTAR